MRTQHPVLMSCATGCAGDVAPVARRGESGVRREALERLIAHYDDWGKVADAARYRKLLAQLPAAANGSK